MSKIEIKMEQLPPSHRALQLSHEEILLITEALNNRYLSVLKFIDDNKQFLSDNARSEILKSE